jgi:hypothetical protein
VLKRSSETTKTCARLFLSLRRAGEPKIENSIVISDKVSDTETASLLKQMGSHRAPFQKAALLGQDRFSSPEEQYSPSFDPNEGVYDNPGSYNPYLEQMARSDGAIFKKASFMAPQA